MGSLAGEPVPAPFFHKDLKSADYFLVLTQRKEVLRAFHGLAKPPQKFLQVLIAFHEINLRSVHHEQVRSRIAEKEMFVGIRHGFQIFGRNLRLGGIALLRNSFQEHIRFGLQINHKVWRRNGGCKHVEITFVKFEFFIIQIEISENFISLEQEIADDGSGSVLGLDLHQSAMAIVKEIHLGAERGAALFVVEIAEEWVVFAVENAAGVKLLCENLDRKERRVGKEC